MHTLYDWTGIYVYNIYKFYRKMIQNEKLQLKVNLNAFRENRKMQLSRKFILQALICTLCSDKNVHIIFCTFYKH